MDFGTIHSKIENGTYETVDEFIKGNNFLKKKLKTSRCKLGI